MSRENKSHPVVVIFVSAVSGVVIVTGVFVIAALIVAAAINYSVGEIYAVTFPILRGHDTPVRIPPLAYFVFFAYVTAAAQVAILLRRRLAKNGRG
jgi:hypothetical protein